jgi:hypothetical protein
MHDTLTLPTRRSFVAGSAALLASVSAFAAAPQVDPAAPRGKNRDLLTKAYSADKVRSALISRDTYKPFPTIQDRAAWDGLRSARSTRAPR